MQLPWTKLRVEAALPVDALWRRARWLGLCLALALTGACEPAPRDEAGEEGDGGVQSQDLSASPEDEGVEGPSDTGGEDDSGREEPGAGSIAIYLTGDDSQRFYEDGLAGQTPSEFVIAVSRYELLTRADDPSPVLCFDRGDAAPSTAPLAEDSHIGSCDTASVPRAVYTHGRIRVEWLRYTVQGTVHSLGVAYPGSFSFFRAYSDTSYEGVDYRAGEGLLRFEGLIDNESQLSFDDDVQIPGISTALIDGEYWMTFEYTTPLPIDPTDDRAHWARFHWEIYRGFRWRDRRDPGYRDGVWDTAIPAEDSEELVFGGMTGYHVTSSIDEEL